MSVTDPAQAALVALETLRAALAAARAAPAAEPTSETEEDNADISTPRARAAGALEATLRARYEWHWDRDERAAETLCKLLMDMCAWHEHPKLRDQILDLQTRGIGLLVATPDGQPSM